ADVPDLVRVFQEVLERARSRPVLDVSEDAITVAHMIDFVRRRLLMEDGPVPLDRLLANTRSQRALIALFLALLELVRLQAILLRQEANFSQILIKKHEQFEQVMTDRMSQMKDDWA
ncbi:MAG TPA: segregation/condensation protein A, partial [Acidobacteriaceae bacterium]